MPSRRSALGSAISSGKRERGRVALVATDEVAQHQRRVGHIARQRPGLVERGGERDHPVARDGAVRRLQADDPAQRRGLADRAAGVGAERPRRQPGGDRRGAAARGATGDALAVPGVEHRAVGGVLVRGAHRELVLVGLPQQARAGGGQARDGGGGVRRQVALEDLRPRLAGYALGAEQVLHRQRHTVQSSAPGALRGAVAGRRLRRSAGRHPREAVQPRSRRRARRRGRGRPRTAPPPRARRRRSSPPPARRTADDLSVAHACGLGTEKPSSLTAGAWASATSRGSESRGSSARSRGGCISVGDDVRHRRDVVEVELRDRGDVVEHRGELARHRLELILAQLQARQARHVQNLVAVDHGPHSTERPAHHAAADPT